jgi:hypothetical protein
MLTVIQALTTLVFGLVAGYIAGNGAHRRIALFLIYLTDAFRVEGVRWRQQRGEPDGRFIGVGLAFFCEQGAHGANVLASWGGPSSRALNPPSRG